MKKKTNTNILICYVSLELKQKLLIYHSVLQNFINMTVNI